MKQTIAMIGILLSSLVPTSSHASSEAVAVEVVTSRGVVRLRTGSDAVEHFGTKIDVRDLTRIVEDRNRNMKGKSEVGDVHKRTRREDEVMCAAYLLGQAKEPTAFPHLLALLDDPHLVMRGYAAMALEKYGDRRALPMLLAVLKQGKPCNGFLVPAIGTLGDDTAIPTLIDTIPAGGSTGADRRFKAIEKITGLSLSAIREEWGLTYPGERHRQLLETMHVWWDENKADSRNGNNAEEAASGDATEPVHNEQRPEEPVLRLRGEDFPVSLRRIIVGYDSLVALIEVGGELFAGTVGTVFTLRSAEETCKVASIDRERKRVIIHRPSYGLPQRTIEITTNSAPARDWDVPSGGLSASLTTPQSAYPYKAAVPVTLTLQNVSDKELVVETGWRRKPHFWFLMSHSQTEVVNDPPSLTDERLWRFNEGRNLVKPVKLPPGKKISVELNLNDFLRHEVGEPCMMMFMPIGSRPAWYEVVGLYQYLGENKDVWFGSVTSNKIAFRILPKKEESGKVGTIGPAD